ncbi:MAG: hypothetical protein ON057_001398 [Glomeribacter sp. 1016415]|nr:hypothetical protein [Glomeribacter sp. 1016415]
MIIILSPAKSLDYKTPAQLEYATLPAFAQDSAQLIDILRTFSPAQIATLMGLSDELAHLNFQRYADWSPAFPVAQSKQAILAFNGDVYAGLNAATLTADALLWAQAHLRILSGLYGVLRPLDLMQPYRLEMGIRLPNSQGKDLYAFWGEKITQALNAELDHTLQSAAPILLNLASAEYFKSIKPKLLKATVITPIFEDWKNGRYKIISFYAKRARGLMARYAVLNQIDDVVQLKDFDSEGYRFEPQASDELHWVFRRRMAA